LKSPRIPSPPISREVSTRPYKVFAYADDANALIKLEYSSLRQLRNVLDDFGKLSGLECNVEKTTLVQVGTQHPISDDILNLGFAVKDEVTTLGINLKGPVCSFADSVHKIGEKLQRQVNHWSRFNLSLSGRIAVTKSMLYSQINYLCSFLPVTAFNVTEFGNIIEKFVSGNLNIARKRIYRTVAMGGLGLFEITSYLDAQRCSWVRRARNIDDLWKIRLNVGCYGTIFNLRGSAFANRSFPCLEAISSSYEKFLTQFTCVNENFKCAYIFQNKSFTTSLTSRYLLDESFFGNALYTSHKRQLVKLRYSDFFDEQESILPYPVFRHNVDIPISQFLYLRLRGALNAAKTKFNKTSDLEKRSVDIATFICRSSKGSCRFRAILSYEPDNYIPHNIVKFAENTETVTGLDLSKSLNKLWNRSFYSTVIV
jgi:hypothetical protein